MLLAIDMGNSHVEIGLLDGGAIVMSERLQTDISKTDTEYALLIRGIFELRGVDTGKIEGAIISSVVPPLTFTMRSAVKKAAGISALVVGPGVRSGLRILIDDPRTLGADLVVGAVAGSAIYGAPLIIIDLGTATTISSVSEDGSFTGGVIMPGANVSLNALVSDTSQLPRISLKAPEHAIGTNTVDSMRSGIVLGHAAMLEGMIDRIAAEMGGNPKIVATGGLAKVIIPHCRREIILDNDLMIRGLGIIYDRNRS